jgi:cyclase
VIACGGAGKVEHVTQVIEDGLADAVSAASLFHYNYLKPVDTLFMSSNSDALRMGNQVDEGNVDYLKDELCGGIPWTMIEPASIPEVKKRLLEHGIACRETEPSGELGIATFGGQA